MAREFGLRFHSEGAYGGAGPLAPSVRNRQAVGRNHRRVADAVRSGLPSSSPPHNTAPTTSDA
ncbi:hypothetical protein GCM10010282_65380 [Streptomyces roseolus]|nr:hypothetical protein GCM10010282_65380 [Streptomyces roseolus]